MAQGLDDQRQTDLDNSVVPIKVSEESINASDNSDSLSALVLRELARKGEQKWRAEIYDPKVKRCFEAFINRKTHDQLYVTASCCRGLLSDRPIWRQVIS